MTILYWIIGIVLSIACAVTCAWICDKYNGMPNPPALVTLAVFGTFIPGIPTFIFFMVLAVASAAAAFTLEIIVGILHNKESKK